MNVRFQGSGTIYQMKVTVPAEGLVQLHFPIPDGVEVITGFEVLTEKGTVYGDYTGYTTIYREMEDGSIILSNDASVYVPPAPSEAADPEPEPEPEPPTLEEVRTQKLQEVGEACRQIIHAGVDVVLPDDTVEHFSLKEEDQINLFGKQAQLVSGAEKLEYHQDSHPCRYYTAEEVQAIITAAMQHVSYHTTYCNSLNMWIAGATTTEELNTIFYGVDIPEEYQSEVLKDYLVAVMGNTGEVEENEAVS